MALAPPPASAAPPPCCIYGRRSSFCFRGPTLMGSGSRMLRAVVVRPASHGAPAAPLTLPFTSDTLPTGRLQLRSDGECQRALERHARRRALAGKHSKLSEKLHLLPQEVVQEKLPVSCCASPQQHPHFDIKKPTGCITCCPFCQRLV